MSGAARQNTYRQKRKQAGEKQVTIWLSPKAQEAIAKTGLSPEAAINRALCAQEAAAGRL